MRGVLCNFKARGILYWSMNRIFRFEFLWLILLLSLPLAGLGAQSLEREAFLDAEARFLGGNYALALERYDEFLQAWPASSYAADARYRRAISLYRLGRASEAYRALLTLESRFRATKYIVYVPFWKGVIEYDRGEYAAAIPRFEALRVKPPDRETLRQSLVYLGKAAAAAGYGDKAVSAFEELFRELAVPPLKREDEPSALLILADLYGRRASHRELLALWETLDPSRLDPSSREQLSLRAAESYLAMGNEAKALPLFQALSDSSRRDIAGSALQRLLERERRSGNEAGVQAVVVKAENLLRTDPAALAEFWLGVGAGAFAEGRYDLAQSYFQRISAILGPDRVGPEVPIYLSEIAFRRGDVAGAYRTLSQAERTAQGDLSLLTLRLGWYALRLQDWSASERHFADALVRSESAGRADLAEYARSYRAYALYRSGRLEESLSSLGSSSAPSPEPGPRLRAELLRRTGRAEAALESFDALIAADGRDGEAQVLRMALFFEKGQYARVLDGAAILGRSGAAEGLSEGHRFAAAYMKGIAAASAGDYGTAVQALEGARAYSRSAGSVLPWAEYYRSWALYRSSRFEEAASSFAAFLSAHGTHALAYEAAYLASWSYARSSDYRNAVRYAALAGDRAASGVVPRGESPAEAESRARFLEGTLRPFLSDWTGAAAALNRAAALQTPYSVRAAFELGTVRYLEGKIDEADSAFAAVTRNYADHPLAAEAAFRRGELLFGVKRWAEAADRFAAYRQSYPGGNHVEAALYFGGLSQNSLNRPDAAILLWERLLREYPEGRYRFGTMVALGQAHWAKSDWEAAFRVYTTAMAEYGDQARAAKLDEEAETLRYLMARLPEKAARLHVRMNRENGAATPAGRAAALELARFYISETAQREAGAALADEVIALRRQAPAAAAEALYLKGEYFSLLESWEPAAAAYLDAVSLAADLPATERTTAGLSLRNDLVPESLFKAARARLRAGRSESAAEAIATLTRLYPSSTWTVQARRLMEASR